MKKVLLVLGILIVVMLVFLFLKPGLDLKEYENLKNPQISSKPVQNMLVVEFKGDPNKSGKQIFSKLFGTYYQLKSKNSQMKPACPRARWLNIGKTKDEMIGIYGIPVPDSISELPAQKQEEPMAKLDKWAYGEVAEILHIGSYSEETPSIEKLMKYIKDNGYEIAGPHEEEYLRGPENIFRSPKDYWTIIRYNVKKKAS